MGILEAESFSILLTTNISKVYSIGQLVFVYDIIILIKHKVDWELIYQRKQRQINKYNIRENNKIVGNDYKFRDKVMLNNHSP